MGLTKEVRDFFTGRIFNVLNGKIEKISETMDAGKINELAQDRLEKRIGVKNVLVRAQKLKQQKAQLEQDERQLAEELGEAMKPLLKDENTNRHRNYGEYTPSLYGSSVIEYFKFWAERFERDNALLVLYPEQAAQIKTIENLKGEVNGVVLLASTERKLVSQLNKVLNSYGGDISELLALLPDDV